MSCLFLSRTFHEKENIEEVSDFFNCESFAVFFTSPVYQVGTFSFCVALKMECCDLQLAF